MIGPDVDETDKQAECRPRQINPNRNYQHRLHPTLITENVS